MARLAPTLLGLIALAGEWVSTPDGRRVCQLRYSIVSESRLQPGFCENWQTPFVPPLYAEPYPVRDGWIRSAWPSPGIQLHIEGKGWRP